MSSDLELMERLTNTPENGIYFDRTSNGNYTLIHCGNFNGPSPGYIPKRCGNKGKEYDKELVKKFDRSKMKSLKIRKIIDTYIDIQRKNEGNYRIEREAEFRKQAPKRTNVLIERTEIPIWTGQDFEIWRNELEIWAQNDRATEETK